MGLIAFYEGNDATQSMVQAVEDTPGQSFHPVHNGPIRSAKLLSVRPGCAIYVYKSPDGSESEDFCIINTKRKSPEYIVNTFERSYEDEYVRVTYVRSGGGDINGNVGRIRIS
jgi:hypothetical protein